MDQNRTKIKDLLSKTKLISQSMEYRRRMVAVRNSEMKQPMNQLWVDPDRGNFHPDFEADSKQLKAVDLNKELAYNKIFIILQAKRYERLKYYGLTLSIFTITKLTLKF